MANSEDKLPRKSGATEAMKKLKEMRKKEPSNKLVKIIKEVTLQLPENRGPGVAAKEVEL